MSFENARDITPVTPEKPSGKEKREGAITSIRGRFKRAISRTVAISSIYVASSLISPATIGFNREAVEGMLGQKQSVTEYVKNADKSVKEGGMDVKERNKIEKTIKQARYIEKKIGRDNFDIYFGTAGEDEEVKGRFKDKILNFPNINSIEAGKIGIDPRTIQEELNHFPHSWIESVDEINFINKDLEMLKEYGVKRRIPIANFNFNNEKHRSKISYYKNYWTETGVIATLHHEMGHANSWVNRRRDMPSRIDLFARTIERVTSKDRYFSEYVEAINNKDKKAELMHKTNEYWAEIVKVSLFYGNALPKKDRELVGDYLDKENKQNIPEIKLGNPNKKLY
ncbi:hypothetical protein HYT00_00755 [Candidatus Giovannonibacteria bacterium]|nr:hypothetical protein [Candidatus Giovannonibacteria bacterium]